MTLGGREGSPPIRLGRPHVQRTGRHVTKGCWISAGVRMRILFPLPIRPSHQPTWIDHLLSPRGFLLHNSGFVLFPLVGTHVPLGIHRSWSKTPTGIQRKGTRDGTDDFLNGHVGPRGPKIATLVWMYDPGERQACKGRAGRVPACVGGRPVTSRSACFCVCPVPFRSSLSLCPFLVLVFIGPSLGATDGLCR